MAHRRNACPLTGEAQGEHVSARYRFRVPVTCEHQTMALAASRNLAPVQVKCSSGIVLPTRPAPSNGAREDYQIHLEALLLHWSDFSIDFLCEIQQHLWDATQVIGGPSWICLLEGQMDAAARAKAGNRQWLNACNYATTPEPKMQARNAEGRAKARLCILVRERCSSAHSSAHSLDEELVNAGQVAQLHKSLASLPLLLHEEIIPAKGVEA
eukprot:1161212-Pelagomonas_calceolata.AAC.5